MLNGQCFTTILKETLNDKNIEQCTAELRDVLIKREDGVKEFIKKFSFLIIRLCENEDIKEEKKNWKYYGQSKKKPAARGFP